MSTWRAAQDVKTPLAAAKGGKIIYFPVWGAAHHTASNRGQAPEYGVTR